MKENIIEEPCSLYGIEKWTFPLCDSLFEPFSERPLFLYPCRFGPSIDCQSAESHFYFDEEREEKGGMWSASTKFAIYFCMSALSSRGKSSKMGKKRAFPEENLLKRFPRLLRSTATCFWTVQCSKLEAPRPMSRA